MKPRRHVQAGVNVYFFSMVLVLTMQSEVMFSCLLQLFDITYAYFFSYG